MPKGLLIFSTQQNLKLLSRATEWEVDGTFSRAPKLFKQMYSLHIEYIGKYIPVVYGVVTNKSTDLYELFYL